MRKDVAAVVQYMQRKHGSLSVTTMSDEGLWSHVTDGVSTGSLELDLAIGRPGVPRGRFTEIVGLEASGKSTALLHIIAETQKRGGVGILFDPENAHDAPRARRIGVNTDDLITPQAPTLESCFDQSEELIHRLRARHVDLITVGVDSVAGYQSGVDQQGAYDDTTMGVHARILSFALRKLTPIVAQEKVVFVFINQLKEKIGGYTPRGQPVYSSLGGHAIRYHASLRLQVFGKEIEYRGTKTDGDALGVWARVTTIKNKIADPFKEGRVLIRFDRGFDPIVDTFRAALRIGFLQDDGKGWYTLRNGKKIREAQWREILKQHGLRKIQALLREQAMARGYLSKWEG
jgi:recombination protein RecA